MIVAVVLCVWHILHKTFLYALAEVWEWEDELGSWHSFTASLSRLLEASHLCSVDNVSFTSMGKGYTVDLKRMIQVENGTKTERNIQRVDISTQAGNQILGGHEIFRRAVQWKDLTHLVANEIKYFI